MIRSWLRRYRGFVGLGVRRVVARAAGDDGRRLRQGIVGVAIAVAVLLLVTAVGVGLAADPAVRGSEVDYWITPADGGGSALVDTGGPSLGSVHDANERLASRDDVHYATPVLASPLRVQSVAGEGAYVLVVGVVGATDARRIAGLSPSGLTPGDPYYAGGSYDGAWTGDLVASPAAASVLDVEAGDELSLASGGAVPDGNGNSNASDTGNGDGGSGDADNGESGDGDGGNGESGNGTDTNDSGDSVQSGASGEGLRDSFTVRTIDESASGPTRDTPIVLVQLSELQAITGAAEHDQADQLLVASASSGVEDDLEGLYPETTVETRSGVLASETLDQGLPLALAATGFLVALVVGTLFVCTTLGMEVVSDRRALATMAALGVGTGGRLAIVATQVLTTTLLGGLLGTLLGFASIAATNRVVAWQLGLPELAVAEPLLALYGVGGAALVGCCSLPYLLVLVRRIGVEGVTGSA